ncbi:MAG: CRISPR-associated protein (TIGR02584 family) [Paraglaciecola sp.]|jgi:CRISPR-associated protein (TIGR02584 family)
MDALLLAEFYGVFMSGPKRTLLLAVTGISPQVVTETLFAIYQQGLDWPDEIQIITTLKGSEEARLNLLAEGKLAALCQEYNLTVPLFSDEQILVVPDASGNKVDDARTLEDQQALADFITQKVAALTADKNLRIHASIAGGRKTMTFFLGYAMSIFGRDVDRISHVLVSEKFEGNRDFYYPTKHTKVIGSRSGSLDCSKAEVMLAEIPFISQRDMFNDEVIAQFSQLRYSELVKQIRLAQQPEKVTLKFDFDKNAPCVWLNQQPIDFKDRKLDFAFYAMMARSKDIEEDPIERPTTESSKALVSSAFYRELALLANITMSWGKDEVDFLEKLEDVDILETRTVKSLMTQQNDGSTGVNVSFFDTRKNNLYKYLKQKLPQALADLIMPSSEGKNKAYRMNLPSSQITFSKE